MKKKYKSSLPFIFTVLISHILYGQADSLSSYPLDTVYIKAYGIRQKKIESPLPINKVDDFKKYPTSHLSIQQHLGRFAGIYTMNTHNFAQDIRISMRGYGMRSSFGVRGIKILVDGFPQSTPDGQGQLDDLYLKNIKSIEVLTGSGSFLFGNASGGTILIETIEQDTTDYISFAMDMSSIGLKQYSHSFHKSIGNQLFTYHVQHMDYRGYRAHSQSKTTRLQLAYQYRLPNYKLKYLLKYTNSPLAQDPGALNSDIFGQDPFAARDRNIAYDAGESVYQLRSGIYNEWKINPQQIIQATAHYNFRDFAATLPFQNLGHIGLKRNHLGKKILYQRHRKQKFFQHRIQIGTEWQKQMDHRMRHSNILGIKDTIQSDHAENLTNTSLFAMYHLGYKKYRWIFGVRSDHFLLHFKDLLSPINPSQQVSYTKISPAIGISRTDNHRSYYLNFRQAYELPTLNELSNNPNGEVGLNTDLLPQNSYTIEIGFSQSTQRFALQTIAYHDIALNELMPYELEEFPGRRFYQNAGKTRRIGLDLSLSYQSGNRFSASMSQTLIRAKYINFHNGDKDISNNIIPGIPMYHSAWNINYHINSSLELAGSLYFQSSIFATDDNDLRAYAGNQSNLQITYKLDIKAINFRFQFSINNVFNTHTIDNIRVNAFGNNFFESAPPRHFSLSIISRFER